MNNNLHFSNLLERMLLNQPYSLEEEEEDEYEETDVSGEIVTIIDSSGTHTNSARSFFERLANNINESVIDVDPEFKKVLTDTGEAKLKTIKYKDSQKKNTSCPILFTDFEDEEDVIELDCLHCFDVDSIKKWLKEESAVCPVCRHELKDIREEKIEKPSISPEEINRSIQLNYMNSLTEHMNTVINHENDLYIQRLLLQQYEC